MTRVLIDEVCAGSAESRDAIAGREDSFDQGLPEPAAPAADDHVPGKGIGLRFSHRQLKSPSVVYRKAAKLSL
jgi:hypothetical protein